METTSYLDPRRVGQAKTAYTTGRVRRDGMATLVTGHCRPRPGDVVLAEIAQIGQHKRLESPAGRHRQLFPGDEILVCYGNRYAPDQFEAEVPDDLSSCHLVAGGGVASRVLSKHATTAAATTITPVGLVANRDGRVVNLGDFALSPVVYGGRRPLTIAVVGTSMNAGKTTAAAHLIRGLRAAGLHVGAAKVTGTGSGKDAWLLRDAGAGPVFDFTDAGFATTYRAAPTQIEGVFELLTDHLAAAGAEAIVLEVADGLYQAETAALIAAPSFHARVDGVLFAAGEAMAAATGVEWLRTRGVRVHGVCGVLTASPLAAREAAAAVDTPVLTLDELGCANILRTISVQVIAA